MDENIILQDPIGWLIMAKKDFEKAKIHFSPEQWSKLLEVYMRETFETYRAIITKATEQPRPYAKEFGFQTIDIGEEEENEEN